MDRDFRAPAPRENLLLDSLPAAIMRRLRQHFEPVPLETGAVLYEPGEPIVHAYFPTRGVISVVSVLQDGRGMEAGTIGREGMSGALALLGISSVPQRYVVQVPGMALRIRIDELHREAPPESPLSRLLMRYYVAFNSQVTQSVACAGLHSVEQRCCRWLLTTDDRVPSDSFSLTHEFLAFMLGTRRTSVSQVLKKVQDRGLIRYHRGTITIVDRRGLESQSCECYRVVAETYRHVVECNGLHAAS